MNRRIIAVLVPIILEAIALFIAGTSGAPEVAASGGSAGGAAFAAAGNVVIALVVGLLAGIANAVCSISSGANPLTAVVCMLLSLFALFSFSFMHDNLAMPALAVVFFAIPLRKAFV